MNVRVRDAARLVGQRPTEALAERRAARPLPWVLTRGKGNARELSTTANALGAGFQFNDDGSSKAYDWKTAGTSFASNIASVTASYYAAGALAGPGSNKEVNGILANQIGRAANVLTASLLGDANAVNAYRPQGLFNTIGTNIGDILADRANGGRGTGEPLRELLGGSAILTARREQELADEATDPKSGAKQINDPMANLFGAIGSGLASGASAVWGGIKSGASAVGGFFKEQVGERFANLFGSAGSFSTNAQVDARAVQSAASNLANIVAQMPKSALTRDAAISAGMDENEMATLFAAKRAGKISGSQLDALFSELGNDFDIDLADRLAEPENEFLAGRAGGMVKKPGEFKFSAEQTEKINFLKSHGYVVRTQSNKIVLKAGVTIEQVAGYLPDSMGGIEVLEQIQDGKNQLFARYTSVMHKSGSERNDSANPFGLKRGRGAYVNGFKDANYVDDGGAIYRDASGKYIALNTPQKIAAFLQNPDRDRILYTQNGMQNQLKDAIGMMEQAGQIARDKGGFRGGSLMIFNDTGGYTADGVNYINSSEKAQRTLEFLLEKGVFKKGDIFIGHSQGGQITTNAIAANKKYVPVQLLVFGSAHTATPNKLVERMVDFRNAHDPVAGEQVVGVFNRNAPDASKNNYERYEQVTYPGLLPKIHWGGSSQYQKHEGGTGHSFSGNYLDALEWYLSQKGGHF